jgi:hypothetical protein
MSTPNAHRAWLTELRSLSARISSGLPDDQPGTVPNLQQQISALRDQLINTPPTDKTGVLIQVELLKDIAWADPVRRLAISISKSIETLWRE